MDEPNWKIESDYDYVDHLSPSALAFEFLRRNPDYQTDDDAFTAKIEQLITKLDLDETTKNLVRSDPDFWVLDPEIIKNGCLELLGTHLVTVKPDTRGPTTALPKRRWA